MASLAIIDTGWASILRTGSQVSVISNSGSAIDLTQTQRLSFTRGAGIEVDPEPGTSSTTAQRISSENEIFSIEIALRKTETADRATALALLGRHQSSTNPGIDRTDGIKALYVTGVTDERKTIIETIGATGTLFHGNEVPSASPAVFGFVKNIRAADSPDGSMWRISFEFVTS